MTLFDDAVTMIQMSLKMSVDAVRPSATKEFYRTDGDQK